MNYLECSAWERMEGEKRHQHQKWLDESISNGLIRELDALTIRGLQFQHVEKGLIRFKFVIPEHLSVIIFLFSPILPFVILEFSS